MTDPVKPVKYSVANLTSATGLCSPKGRSSGAWQHGKVFVDVVLLLCTIACACGIIYGLSGLTDMGLIDKKQLTTFLSIASPLVTMTQYIAPAPVVMDGIKMMNAQNLPTPVFQSQAACNILGLSYGIQIANPAVLVTNMFGLACQILFLASDHHVRSPNVGWMSFSVKLTAIFNTTLYFCAMVAPIDILGHLITIFNVVLFAVPLGKLGSILRTKNVSSLPVPMTCISVANNFVWSLYALMLQDQVLFLPSILGFVLSGFQVLVILWGNGYLPFDLAFLLLPCREKGDKLVLPTGSPRKDPEESDFAKSEISPAVPHRVGQTPRRILAGAEWELPLPGEF